MSVEAIAVALHHGRVSGTAKTVLVGIANHDGDGGAWPSIATLAKYANVDERSVQRAIQQLVSKRYIAVELQQGGTRLTPDHRRPNRYVFLLRCPEDCDGSTGHKTRQQVLFDRLAPASPGDASVTPPGDASVTPPGDASVTRTIPTEPTSEDDHSADAQGETSAREAEPVDKPLVWVGSQPGGKPFCSQCRNGWLPNLIDPDGPPRPCLRCKPHLRHKTRGFGR